jgi:hypothetical protein
VIISENTILLLKGQKLAMKADIKEILSDLKENQAIKQYIIFYRGF